MCFTNQELYEVLTSQDLLNISVKKIYIGPKTNSYFFIKINPILTNRDCLTKANEMARSDALFAGTSLWGRAQTKSYLLYITNGTIIQTNSRSNSNKLI